MADKPQGFTVDFSQVEDREAIPAGTYRLECVDCEVRASGPNSKNPGTPMIWFHWKVVGGEHDNARIFENLMLSGDALWKTKQLYIAMYGKQYVKENPTFSGDASEFVGAQLDAKVIQQVWAEEDGGDGEPQNKVGRYLPLKADAQPASKLDDLFGSQG